MSQIKVETPFIKEETDEKKVLIKSRTAAGKHGLAFWNNRFLHHALVYETEEVLASEVPEGARSVPVESGKTIFVQYGGLEHKKDESFCRPDALYYDYASFASRIPDEVTASRLNPEKLPPGSLVLYKDGNYMVPGQIWGDSSLGKYGVQRITPQGLSMLPKAVQVEEVEVLHKKSAMTKDRWGNWVWPGRDGKEEVVKKEEMPRLPDHNSQPIASLSYGAQIQPPPARDAVESRDADRINVSTTAAHPPAPPPAQRSQPPLKPSTAERDRALLPRDAAVSRKVVSVPAAHRPKVIPPRKAVRRARGLTAGPLKANASRGNTDADEDAAAEHRRYLLPEGDGKTEDEREEQNSLYDTITPNDGIVEDESPEGDAAAAAYRDARRCELCWGVFCGCE